MEYWSSLRNAHVQIRQWEHTQNNLVNHSVAAGFELIVVGYTCKHTNTHSQKHAPALNELKFHGNIRYNWMEKL